MIYLSVLGDKIKGINLRLKREKCKKYLKKNIKFDVA